MIDRAKRIASAVKSKILGEVDKTKALGTHIYRPLYNADEWAAWLTAAGVPEPKTAEELRVSILQITGQFQLVPNTDAHVFRTETCVFGVVGGKLVAIWYDYGYYDRHWMLREIVGYDCWCPTSRAMLVLSDAPGEFIFSDESLLTVPKNIALAGEKSEPLDGDTVMIVKSARVTPTAEQQEKAKAALLKLDMADEADPFAQARLFEISKGFPLVVAEAEAELGSDLAAIIDLAGAEPAKEVRKTAAMAGAQEMQIVKRADDRQMIYGWASVSTVDGVLYEDLHGDTIAVDALHDACTLIVKSGQNLGGIEHGDTPNAVAAAFVIDDDWAAAMSENFYFEGDVMKTKKQGLFFGYNVVDKEQWEASKDEPIEFSINATAYIADKEAN